MSEKYSLRHKKKILTYINDYNFMYLDKFLFFNRSLNCINYVTFKLYSNYFSNIKACCVFNKKSRAVYSSFNLSRILLKLMFLMVF